MNQHVNRWHVLYDEAAKTYAEACRQHVSTRTLKKWFRWLDGKLAERGE